METITIAKVCPFCRKNRQMTFDKKQFEDGMRKYEAGALIQNAFPNFTPSEREFILTGICDNCWNDM